MLLVVGATGQLGSLLVRLLREQGEQVRALVRPGGPPADDLAATGAELVHGDLREPGSLDAAVDGVDGVLATANVVAPGFVVTDMTNALTDDQRKAIIGQIPARRYAEPEEIAGVVTFLASDAAGYINGAVLPVDGGLGMGH